VGVIRETYIGEKDERAYLPAYDINKLTVGDVITRIDRQGNELFLSQPTEECQMFWQRYIELRDDNSDVSKVLVKDLMEQVISQPAA
jgi:hypothetical protein